MIARILFAFVLMSVTNAARFAGSREGNMVELPDIEVVKTVEEVRTHFTGKFHSAYNVFDVSKQPLNASEEERYLSWEVASPQTGARVEKLVSFHKRNTSKENLKMKRHRQKRNIYHNDDRKGVSSIISSKMFPYVAVVKVSTGCTGTLISPKHVLTAAHCIHDQTDYVEGYKNLKIGFVQPRRYRSYRWRKIGRKTRLRKVPPVKWKRVVNSFLPQGWTIGIPDIASLFDYSLLELDTEHNKEYFKLGISEKSRNGQGKTIYFTSFEDDKPLYSLWYRACQIMDTDAHVLYHYCDALPGSSGAGVYAWEDDVRTNIQQRVLIGVFSGNRWKMYRDGDRRVTVNYNAAIRMNSAKYTQICKWMGKYSSGSCNKKYYVT